MNVPEEAEARPVDFPGSNFTYRAPVGMEAECGDLPCYRQPGMAISCWKFGLLARLRFLFTGRIFLWLLTDSHPPVTVTTEAPQFEAKK